MSDSLSIVEVARRTGLTARALRFYEARGLVSPLRTASGRRAFAAADLERLGRIVALKQAGFSLSEIARLLDGEGEGLGPVLRRQLAAIDRERLKLEGAAQTMRHALSRIDAGERLDAATLCSLIEHGKTVMTERKQWDDLSSRYLGGQAKADFAATPMPDGFDQTAYAAQWAALGAKIKAALPLDPAGETAQALLAEWTALLEPFTRMATPAMMEGVSKMYSDMPNWGAGAPSPGFDHEVWQFVQAAGQARKANP